jgi:hypothetical protein
MRAGSPEVGENRRVIRSAVVENDEQRSLEVRRGARSTFVSGSSPPAEAPMQTMSRLVCMIGRRHPS